MTHKAIPPRLGIAFLTAAWMLASCTSEQQSSPEAPFPASLAQPVEAEGARFLGLALADPKQAEAFFGFDIVGAGLLPVLIRIDNKGDGSIKIIPRETFLIDQAGQAWPMLTASQASARLGGKSAKADSLDSLTGFAIQLATEPLSPNTDTARKKSLGLSPSTPLNPAIAMGEMAKGALFFPGRNEAAGVNSLRLCYENKGKAKFLNLPLKDSKPAN